MNLAMTPWTEFDQQSVSSIPENILGVFQLAKDQDQIAYVGRADENLRATLQAFLGKGYHYFQWVRVPWAKEAFEMQCRLYHHGKHQNRLDNLEHPMPPKGVNSLCPLSFQQTAMCED